MLEKQLIQTYTILWLHLIKACFKNYSLNSLYAAARSHGLEVGVAIE